MPILCKRCVAMLMSLVIVFLTAVGCSKQISIPSEKKVALAGGTETLESSSNDEKKNEIQDLSVVPVSGEPAVVSALMPEASGKVVLGNSKAEIDASNTADGYVMIKYLEKTDMRLKVIVKGPSGVKYYYNLTNSGAYEVFPLSDGNGNYTFQICKNIKGTSYSISYSTKLDVKLKDEFAPYLLPNQYVDYKKDSKVVLKAAELTAESKSEIEKIKAVYEFVVENFTYDKQRAETVQSGYLPVLDDVLENKKGICFDYAAVMTAMLRSQGIPCKLVIGDAGKLYHAWINVWSEKNGWMDSVIYFDGKSWKLMDPTFASSSNSSESVMNYVSNGSNYSARYIY